MKISKRVREEAALICAIAASSGEGRYAIGSSTWDAEYERHTTLDTDAGLLARKALSRVPPRFQGRAAYAEAEALLRTGWMP